MGALAFYDSFYFFLLSLLARVFFGLLFLLKIVANAEGVLVICFFFFFIARAFT